MPNPITWQRELRRSLALFRLCFAIVRSDPRLLLLALGNAFLALALGLLVLMPVIARYDTQVKLSDAESAGALMVMALVRMTSTLSNAVLVVLAVATLRGEEASLKSTMRVVMSRLPVILAFSLLAVLVDVVTFLIRKYELPSALSLLTVIHGYLSGLVDTAWQLATFVALPVIVLERGGPVASLRRSRDLIHARWGTGVVAVVGLRTAGIGLAAAGLVLMALAQMAIPALKDVLLVLGMAWVAAVALVITAIGQVYRAAVYLYATEGFEPSAFKPERLRTAFA